VKDVPLLEQLIAALRCLPGVGRKTAQRMAFHLLESDRPAGRQLADTLTAAMEKIGNCSRCRNFSETPLCHMCAGDKRNSSLLCVVESPVDVACIEQAADYRGLYFVLMGKLSPLDGVRPEDLGMEQLNERLAEGVISEIILATGTTMEGEATAHYISQMARSHNVRATRIAHGIPLGGELGYIDSGTLSHAIQSRRDI
jgi:recombination protein RecR